jgi:hypothetical protein
MKDLVSNLKLGDRGPFQMLGVEKTCFLPRHQQRPSQILFNERHGDHLWKEKFGAKDCWIQPLKLPSTV